MATARFKVFDPIDGDITIIATIAAEINKVFCVDPETGVGPDGYGYTWECRLSETHSQLWIRTSDDMMDQMKTLFSSDEYLALGFEHIEDIEEQQMLPVEEPSDEEDSPGTGDSPDPE